MKPSELMQGLASWLDSRNSDEGARRVFGLLALILFGVLAPTYILIQLYRADYGAAGLLVAAAIMWGGLTLGAVVTLLIVRQMRR